MTMARFEFKMPDVGEGLADVEVVTWFVKVGDTVEEKQTVAIMESMKMESALLAPKAGRVAKIGCQAGQVVDMGEILMVIE